MAGKFVHTMSQGAPQDSLVLRVSLCFESDIRGEGHSFLIVEELHWPFPVPTLEFDAETNDFSTVELETGQWWGGAVLIDGSYLNQERRKLPAPQIPGQRAGELCGHCLFPFQSVEWVSPRVFVLESERARFTLEWKEPGVLELTRVVRTG